MKNYLLILFCLFSAFTRVEAQGTISWSPFYKPVYSGSYLQDKNFYLLTLFESIPELSNVVGENTKLQAMLSGQKKKFQTLDTVKNLQLSQVATAFQIDEVTAATVSKEFEILFDKNQLFRETLNFHLRSSGYYSLFANSDNRQLLLSAWNQAVKGMNYIIDEYVLGINERYPRIDSASFPVNGPYYRMVMKLMSSDISRQSEQMTLFFQPSLRFAIELLKMNRRDEASRFEPMEALENRKAFDYIRQINWNDYRYSVILIPGYGPQERDLPLNPHGIYRCRLAAERYNKGLAPLIILSGGYVHPHQTQYCEALEMKKELIKNYGVPEKAIIIEPHARHTTTNFRNACRLIYSYGIPPSKLALVTSTNDQISYILNNNFDQRNIRELGYVPYELHENLSENDIEFLPVITALHHDPLDPLDP